MHLSVSLAIAESFTLKHTQKRKRKSMRGQRHANIDAMPQELIPHSRIKRFHLFA